MKKIILIILALLVMSVCFAEICKTINIERKGKVAKTARIENAWKLDNGNYAFEVTLLDADSTVITTHCYYEDLNAPFQLKQSAELDTLLKVHPNYVKPIKIEKEILQ